MRALRITAQPSQRLLYKLVPCLALACLAHSVYAEDSATDENLDSIVISAQKKEMPLERVTETVNLINEQDLARKGYQAQLSDTLKGMPGIYTYNTGGLAGSSTIRLRGASASGTQIIKDGVPFNDPSTTQGNANMALSADPGVRTIEVVMGPQSSLYGSTAIGGLIQLVPLVSTPEAHTKARLGFGSFATRQSNVQATGPIGDTFGYAIGYSSIDSDGISNKTTDKDGDPDGFEDDPYNKTGIYVRGDYRPREGLLFSLIRDESRGESEYDSTGPDDDVPTTLIRSEKTQLNGEIKLPENFTSQIRLAQSDYDRSIPNATFGNKRSLGTEYYLGLTGSYVFDQQFTASLGYDARKEEIDLIPVAAGPHTEQDATHSGIWAQGAYSVDSLEASLSVRNETHSIAKSATTWRAGAAGFFADKSIKLHASVGTAFRAPSLFELNYGTTVGDDLKPEESLGAEIGLTYYLENIAEYGVTAWLTDYTERIGYDSGGFYANDDERTKVTGLDIFGSYLIKDADLTLAGNITLQNPDDNGGLHERLPKTTANISITWSPSKTIWSSIEVQYVGDREPSQYASIPDDLDAYTLVNLSFGHHLSEHSAVDLQIQNLFDQAYLPARDYAGVPLRIMLGFSSEF